MNILSKVKLKPTYIFLIIRCKRKHVGEYTRETGGRFQVDAGWSRGERGNTKTAGRKLHALRQVHRHARMVRNFAAIQSKK